MNKNQLFMNCFPFDNTWEVLRYHPFNLKVGVGAMLGFFWGKILSTNFMKKKIPSLWTEQNIVKAL